MISMSRNGSSNGGRAGLGLADILLIIFIVLKLCGLISWSWVWVLAPLWISFAFGLLMFVVLIIIFAIANS